MITSSGVTCDVCGKYILPIGDNTINEFKIFGIDGILHSDNSCKERLEDAVNKKDYNLLPEGPLKEVFKDQNQE